MAEMTTLDSLQIFHRELLALQEGRNDGADTLNNDELTAVFERQLGMIWNHPQRSEKSRSLIKAGKVILDDNEYQLNDVFQQTTFNFADEMDLDETEAARYLLESQEDPTILGRSLIECAIIRFHQQRKYTLDALRLLLEVDDLDTDVEVSATPEAVQAYIQARIFSSGKNRLVPKCILAMTGVRAWLQKLNDKFAAAQTLGQSKIQSGEMETVEFSRISLIQQHELLGVILCRSVQARQAQSDDFAEFIQFLKKADKYDTLLVHVVPSIGAFISLFGSSEGGHDLITVRALNAKLFPSSEEASWPLPSLGAAVRAWWLAEYSGFYLDDPPESAIPAGTDLDEEDRQRSRQFLDSLKDGAFDFLLSAAADVKSPDWHDPTRIGMRKWLQRKSPALPADTVQFSEFFQQCFMAQLEIFVDAFISNLPDVLRKLRVEEDEQRQLSQAHEQDLDLERFLLIIAYAYERRPQAASSFWSDPDSNLAGFMHWASRRASTPLVAAFCEMLQAISGNDDGATAAHEFLLDEGHHSSGKMRRSQSLTWTQIFRELDFFSERIRGKPIPSNTTRFREGKPPSDVNETEPESAMMLECYLRLITKLATESETARQFLLQNPAYNVTEKLFELASGPIPPRLRGCIFMAVKALLSRKTAHESHVMWIFLENWITGGYAGTATSQHRQTQQSALAAMERILEEISHGFEDPDSFIQLLLALICPASDSSPLNDALPFPESLGSAYPISGIDNYVDYVMGLVFATRVNDLHDINQARALKLSCLDFMLSCLATFNEDLIVLANETNLMVDSIISTSDLATYVRLHPFSRMMEWMFNDKVIAGLFSVIHQEPSEVGNAAPDSPLILGILRAVEVVSRVLDMQSTYLDLVRPLLKLKTSQRRQPVANAAFASFEDGLVTRLSLIVDLGSYCGLGHPDLSLACLKLLERLSSSTRITSVWSGSGRQGQRNKAIVAMEANGEHEVISRQFIAELMAPLDVSREADSPSYLTKIFILDFLHKCLEETPRRPTIAHLLLGFKCGIDSLSIEANGAFFEGTSLFHSVLRLLLETPSGDPSGMRLWLLSLKSRIMRILHILWHSPLSSPLVINELRENEFLSHLLVRETMIQPDLLWEGQHIAAPEFPLTEGAPALLDFLNTRSSTFEYIGMELCMISQGRMPSVKRQIFEALNGQVAGDGNSPIQTPTVFDLFDFLLPEGVWDWPTPQLQVYQGIDLSVCVEVDANSNTIYNIDRAKEVLLLKRNETRGTGALITAQDLEIIEREEASIIEYLISSNRKQQVATEGIRVLRTWTNLLLVMVETSDFKGSAKTSFFLQALQAILPSLEAFAADRPEEALELAKVAKVLLYKLDLASSEDAKEISQAIGNLVGEKLFQLFQTCLQAIGKWAGTIELRSVYYEICYWYLTGMSADGLLRSNRAKSIQTIHAYGERLINVICEDAYCGDPGCQTAALILLNTLVTLDQRENSIYVVETLNKLNFIGILIDSLRNIMQEWHAAQGPALASQREFHLARLALLLQLAQTRAGAKYILHANLFRTIEVSGLFTADPELQMSPDNPRTAEQHYDLLARVVRIIGAALLSRGNHNTVQGRKFLTDHRMLITHTLKRSAGIGNGPADKALEERIQDLADGFVVIIAATGFLDFENDAVSVPKTEHQGLFH
ncbi:Nucleoporin NUP192 [Paramyrothecium foliicola]|nr:Nucleoporin NUP192 [Paramyrothecium foliicola]